MDHLILNTTKAPGLFRIFFVTIIILSLSLIVDPGNSAGLSQVSSKWKITSIKICKIWTGALDLNLEALGRFPVYSFFIPRPVWTVNGTVVEAQPIHERGGIVAFELLGATALLKPDARNTIKFSLPDQTGSKTFFYNTAKPVPGDCYEFF
jgi:hypothetical protein